jgi:hypothetical protein
MPELRREVPEKATHLVRGYAGRVLIAEVWVQGWGTVETETEVFKSMKHCDRIELTWLANPFTGPPGTQRPAYHVETVWTR